MTATTSAVSESSPSTPSIRSAFLSLDDQRWEATLSRLRHDVYQLPQYVAFALRPQVPGTPIAYLAESGERRLLIPLIVRPMAWAQGDAKVSTDATSPRGFPGPVIGPDDAPDLDAFTDAALADFVMALRDQAIISAFIRLHPFVGPSAEVLARHCALVDFSQSFGIDLGRTDDDLWMQMRETAAAISHERGTLAAASVSTTTGSISTASIEPFRTRWCVWARNRIGYFHARTSLSSARRSGSLHLCVVEIDGELAATSLVTEADGVAEYHLAGTFDARYWRRLLPCVSEAVGRRPGDADA